MFDRPWRPAIPTQTACAEKEKAWLRRVSYGLERRERRTHPEKSGDAANPGFPRHEPQSKDKEAFDRRLQAVISEGVNLRPPEGKERTSRRVAARSLEVRLAVYEERMRTTH